MRCRLLVFLGVVAWVAVGDPQVVSGQDSPDESRSGGTLLDRLDNLGRAIFGGPAEDEEKTVKPQRPKPTTRRPKSDRTAAETTLKYWLANTSWNWASSSGNSSSCPGTT